MKYNLLDNQTIKVDKLGKVKKITGTRLASILGLNVWNTPFTTWCDMTKVYKEPFVDSIYTIAGKVIEPKIIEYLKEKITVGTVIDGEEYWGDDFMKRRFDYYPEETIFGGMWDALILSKKSKKPVGVIEIKTTKRAEDWQDEIPMYYKIQAMLYAKLLGVKTIYFAVSFLDDDIYDDPSQFVASDETVKIISFRLDEDEIDKYMVDATAWYTTHILGQVSPVWDEKKDAEALKFLRTNVVEEQTPELEALLKIVDDLKPQIEALSEKEKALKLAMEAIKKYLLDQFGATDTKVQVESENYIIEVSKSSKLNSKFDEKKYQEDYPEIYSKYLIEEEKETIRQSIKSKNKEDK